MKTENFHRTPDNLSVRRRLKVLISAYACCPDHGSEPEVGWGFSKAMSAHHDVWVLTRTANRERIEQTLQNHPVSGLNFLYYDLPELFNWGKCGGLRMQLHSYFWQLFAVPEVRRIHRRIGFDLSHHVTFAKYWAPSCLAWLNIPFVWGPVGGAEATPRELLSALAWKERLFEDVKMLVSRAGELDPFVRRTVRKAARVFASTEETATRLKKMGCGFVSVMTQIGADSSQIRSADVPGPVCRFISIGRLIHWKGFLLGLRAFEKCAIKDAEYWIIGDGPCRSEMERFAANYRLKDRVKFFGSLSLSEAGKHLASADVLIHPSFHDSAGLVCLEAMALGKPVICLKTGGPASLVDDTCGVCVSTGPAENVCDGLCDSMIRLASDSGLRRRMGDAAQARVRNCFTWQKKADFMAACYHEITEHGAPI